MLLPNNMRWEQDLIEDIRFGDERDDADNTWQYPRVSPTVPLRPTPFKKTYRSPFGEADQKKLLEYFLRVRDNCEFIMEIGVSRDGYARSSTKILIENKLPDTVYLGVDIEPKTELNNSKKNVHTISCRSEEYSKVRDKISQLGVSSMGFFMIDGWHSINQVLLEWEYTDMLAPDGIVGFHDTRYHPGPYLFTKNLNKQKWHVVEDAIDNSIVDFGLGFAWKNKTGD